MRKLFSILLALSLMSSGGFAYGQSQREPGRGPGNGGPGGGHGGPGGGHGGGHPTPTPNPTATPDPTATPAPTATPVNTDQADRDGHNDGSYDGAREGRERGEREGREMGGREGQREGFEHCEREERQRAHDRGYQDGYRDGQIQGINEGQSRGNSEGYAQGDQDGRQDGLTRADKDSRDAATPPGTNLGFDQANKSDASARGRADGLVAGDEEARQQAHAVDYQRGRKDVRQEREAEAVQFNDEFSQLGQQGGQKKLSTESLNFGALSQFNDERRGGGGGHASPDYRYSNPHRNYNTSEENRVYQSSYREGYNNGFSREYGSTFDPEYRRAFRDGEEHGCREARQRDYRPYYNGGAVEGHDRGYSDAYQPAYNAAYRSSYDGVFPTSSRNAYQQSYQAYYDRHFEEARSSAYAARVAALYDAAHEQAMREKFAEVYPGYAKQEYANGRVDETNDFANRPIRLLTAEPTETIANGLFEPGEPIRLKVSFRNFGADGLKGRDIKLVVAAYDAGLSVITQAEATLVKDVRAKSVTKVTDALEFRMNESAVNRAAGFKVSAFYLGRNVGEVDFEVDTKFQVVLKMAAPTQLQDGMPTPVKVKITNQSQAVTDPTLTVTFLSKTDKLEIQNPTQTTPSLNPGESRVLEFKVVAHTSEAMVSIPMAFSVKGATERRIGLLDFSDTFPVVNDYRVSVAQNLAGLLQPGVTRVTYTIINAGSQLVNKSMQLKVSFKDTDHPENFVVIGPNPQFLMPLAQGETVTFTVPVMVKAANAGATLELELKEDGRGVVIHEEDFRTQSAPLNLR